MALRTPLLLLLLALSLTGCASLAPSRFDNDDVNQAISEWSCQGAASSCIKDYAADNAQAKWQRQFRARLILTMFARYGADRIPSDSTDPINDASRLLGRIETALASLDKLSALTDPSPKDSEASKYYEVERVDALIALTDVVVAATQPVRSYLFSFATVLSPMDRLQQAPTLLRNALTDKLYLDAYRKSLETVRQGIVDRSTFSTAKTALDLQLTQHCQALAVIAKQTPHCP